jgi:hypothetical protein
LTHYYIGLVYDGGETLIAGLLPELVKAQLSPPEPTALIEVGEVGEDFLEVVVR